MEDFFKAEGLSRIIFYFQEDENLPDAGTVSWLRGGGGEGKGAGAQSLMLPFRTSEFAIIERCVMVLHWSSGSRGGPPPPLLWAQMFRGPPPQLYCTII